MTKRISFLTFSVLIGLAWLLASAGPVRCADEPSPGWMSLSGGDLRPWIGRRGKGTGDWTVTGGAALDPNDPKRLTSTPGSGILVNGRPGRTVDLLTTRGFGDMEAHVEFMVPEGSNSGVYFMARYELQVLDSWGVEHPKFGDCGGIYARWKDNHYYEGVPPRVNASRRPGEWQSFDVVFRAPRFDAADKKTANARFVKVVHNGIVIHENVEVTGPTRAAAFEHDEKRTGPLMLQGDHGPVAFRNIRVRLP